MREKQPTMASDNPWQQSHVEQAPTVKAASQSEPATVADSPPFQPTHPPQRLTPPGPIAIPPESPRPPATGPDQHTVAMEIKQTPVPLAWLAVVKGIGGRQGHIHPLERETIVGRTKGDLTLNDDPAVSGQHLKIKLETIEEHEVFVLYDMASSNGTYAGDRKTYQEDESRVYRHVLQDGDFLLVGQTTLVFKQV